jgi:hypothetical protein
MTHEQINGLSQALGIALRGITALGFEVSAYAAEVTEMVDGSGDFAVIAYGYDGEREFQTRVRVKPDGTVGELAGRGQRMDG